jgi:hypothetical protein
VLQYDYHGVIIMSKRKELINYINEELKNIDGSRSSYGDQSYIYGINLFRRVERRLVTIEEETNFPSLYSTVGNEIRYYDSLGLSEGDISIRLVGYLQDIEENLRVLRDSFVRDIEHVIYNMKYKPELGMEDLVIDQIRTDEGELELLGYSIIEVILTLRYKIV